MSYKSQYTGEQIDEGIEKASKALTTPDTAPESISLVAVDTNNAQSMLTLGDGLSVADGVISASGKPLYEHHINITGGSGIYRCNIGFSIFNNSPEAFTDLTSASNALLDVNDSISASGVAFEFTAAPTAGEVAGDVTIGFVTHLGVDKIDGALDHLSFYGFKMVESKVKVGTTTYAHSIQSVYTNESFIISPSNFSNYNFFDAVRQIV